MQPGHRGIDSCKGVLEISTKARIPDVDAHKPVVINATRPQHPNMFATQRNHQISSKVLITDQRSPMIRRHRITALTQHRTRLLIGAITHTSGGARTRHPHQITQTTLPQLLSEQRLSHHRSSAIETAYKRDVQPRATHTPYRFPSSAARSSESSKSKFAKVRNSARKKIRVTYRQAHATRSEVRREVSDLRWDRPTEQSRRAHLRAGYRLPPLPHRMKRQSSRTGSRASSTAGWLGSNPQAHPAIPAPPGSPQRPSTRSVRHRSR